MSRRTLELWSALAIVYVVWGSTYLAIKVAVRTLPPLLTAGTRFVGAAFVLAGVLALLGRCCASPGERRSRPQGSASSSSRAASASSTSRRRGSTRASPR